MLLMKNKLKQHPDFMTFVGSKDTIALVTKMGNIVCNREDHMQDAWSLCKLIKFILSKWQGESKMNKDSME